MKNNKVKSINSDLFKKLDGDSLSNLGNIVGGLAKKTKSGATGWTCKDDKDGKDDGDFKPNTLTA